MPSLSGYKAELDYSYAPGIFPAMECLLARPERVRRVLLHSGAAGREGTEKLCAMAREKGIRVEEADRALARISGKENCYAAAVFEKFRDELLPEKPHVLLHQPGDSGNVGRGLPPEFSRIGQPVRIPSNDKVDSLNLAIAAGIGIYAFLDKERRQA